MVHGIGTHAPGYSGRLRSNLAQSLGMTVTAPQEKVLDIIHPRFPDEKLGTLTVNRFTNEAHDREVLYYELTWSRISDPAKAAIAFDNSEVYTRPRAALDNVAKEHSGPLGEELNRALLESRLGLPIEETLEAVAQRMQSRDFHWVVMAIRINRQVGGNLGEVLTNVGKTLRERERLRRQVKTLSAEGKLSAWILGLLPILLIGYMVLVRPEYITPLFVQPIGWVILGAGLVAVPSSVFYDDPVRGAGLVRWAFCKSDAVLDEAIERLDRLRSS